MALPSPPDMPPIRVLVVDDSVVIRRLLTDIIDADPDFEVVGVAANGRIAIDKLTRVQPDVITLDVEMPEMDGLATLREMRARGLRRPTVMFSTLCERGAAATLDAMALGAADYVTKPSNTRNFEESREQVRAELIPKLRALGSQPPLPSASARRAPGEYPSTASSCDIVAIGASTGGPNALTTIIGSLPADLPVPVVVTQHMPPVFTALLAKRLNALGGLPVVEASDGDELAAGTVYIAPGDRHLTIDQCNPGRPRVALTDDPPENSCRPAVDPMFRSVAAVYGSRSLGVVLTGMGQDGTAGARWLKESGAQIYAQDHATSVVWGMPGAAVAADVVDAVLPLEVISGAITQRVMRGHRKSQPGGDRVHARSR